MTADQSDCAGPTPAFARFIWSVLTGAALWLASGPAAAQDPPPPPTASTDTPPAPATAANGDPTRLLLMPYQDLKGTINDLGASIMVPLKDYLEWQKRLRDKPAPAPAVITSASSTSASGTQTAVTCTPAR